MAEEIKLTVAKAPPEQVDGLRNWFHDLEEILDDEHKDVENIGKFIQDTFEARRIDEYERILFGYDTLVANSCDPALTYLEWKPEIKEAVEQLASTKSRLDRAEAFIAEIGETPTAPGFTASVIAKKCREFLKEEVK